MSDGEIWYLQTDGMSAFWDNYIHPQCKIIDQKNRTPFPNLSKTEREIVTRSVGRFDATFKRLSQR